MYSADMDRRAAYAAIDRLPTDPAIRDRMGHHHPIEPLKIPPLIRLARFQAHATTWLMHRELDRDGDL
jgi:hypothetical protein